MQLSNEKTQEALIAMIPQIKQMIQKLQDEVPEISRIRAARLVYLFVEAVTVISAVDNKLPEGSLDNDIDAYLRKQAELVIRECASEEVLAEQVEPIVGMILGAFELLKAMQNLETSEELH